MPETTTDGWVPIIIIVEEWRIIDRWWTEEPVEVEWAEVVWDERTLLFRRGRGDIWRIHKSVPAELS